MGRRAKRGAGAPISDKVPEKSGEEVNRRLLLEDAGGKRMEALPRKEDKLTVKPPLQSLSDSENEEPFAARIFYKSAFVSKSNTNSLAPLSWSIHSQIERSQSCIDPVNEGSAPEKRTSHKAKVSPGSCPSTGVLGILLSKENSRSFSAPVLTSEKRLSVNSLTSFTPLNKPDGSISPDSNDSISEELNHFKPIVCSPCTPPKRLPDGRVLSPVIIKSTPRNLRKSLQKPTTYEASPLILKKWEQVFQERQMKKTSSKGTLTLSVGDSLTLKAVPSDKEPAGQKIESRSNEGEPASSDRDVCMKNNSAKGPDTTALSSPILLPESGPATNAKSKTDPKIKEPAAVMSKLETVANFRFTEETPIQPRRLHKNPSKTFNAQNGTCYTATENISPALTLRRGQKRLCKTKHLEQHGSLKRLRVRRRGVGCSAQDFSLLWREAEKRLQQEEEDKKLALKLQQMFDRERRRVNRCKGSRDEYPLRSKSTASAN
uniref:RING-type E3 ubiquitin transferase n=1 Tax=Leptobrachium leishanense TaxID=445787 RepID=A0A8C5LVT3_9ANUR